MRTTIDIPDETYKNVKILAAQRGSSVRQLVLEGLELVQQTRQKPRTRFELPIIPSTSGKKLVIDNETIYDLIGFP